MACHVPERAQASKWYVVPGKGFEPLKPLGRLIYSQLRLTTPPSRHITQFSMFNNQFSINFSMTQWLIFENLKLFVWSQREDLNPQPAVYKTDALPLSYAGLEDGKFKLNISRFTITILPQICFCFNVLCRCSNV